MRAISTETGRTSSDVVKKTIGQYLGKTTPEGCASTNRRLNKLKQQLARLQRILLAVDNN
ncbi:MAG: hypothetical protein F6K11_09425 [Leptolyngbya sp. SIO3F4]|nr:hypothetical protein [Leptolyngbya sp. SIO3F4]